MEISRDKQTTFNGIRISYQSYGDGVEALIFIHGWLCSNTLWYSQAPLYRKYRSVLIDLPGHGKSDAPDIDYNHELFARAVKAVLEVEGIQKVVLIGHSMGGPISSMFSRLFSTMILGIIYIDSFFFSPAHYLTVEQRQALAATLGDSAFDVYPYGQWTATTSLELRTLVSRTMLHTPRHVRVSAETTNTLPHVYGPNEVYEFPAIQIAAEKFAVIDPHWRSHFSNLKVEVWRGFSHFLFMEDPERFNSRAEQFLEENNLLVGQRDLIRKQQAGRK